MTAFDFNNVHVASHAYHDTHFQENAMKILPGEYFATKENSLIVTVLGSCVSVCLWDPLSSIGGMNHFLLPHDGREDNGVLSASARYGVYAMEILINHLMKLGANRDTLQAKVFGGANVLPSVSTSTVGDKNTEFVKHYLSMEQINIAASDLSGSHPRKVYFFTGSGKVMIKKLKLTQDSHLIERETSYRSRIGSASSSGEIDLFG